MWQRDEGEGAVVHGDTGGVRDPAVHVAEDDDCAGAIVRGDAGGVQVPAVRVA